MKRDGNDKIEITSVPVIEKGSCQKGRQKSNQIPPAAKLKSLNQAAQLRSVVAKCASPGIRGHLQRAIPAQVFGSVLKILEGESAGWTAGRPDFQLDRFFPTRVADPAILPSRDRGGTDETLIRIDKVQQSIEDFPYA